MSAIRPGSAARTAGLVKMSLVARDHRADIGTKIAGWSPDRGRRGGKRGFVDQFGLARPPSVQRGLGGACPVGNRGHGQVRIADFHKQIRGCAQYGSVDTRIAGPPGR